MAIDFNADVLPLYVSKLEGDPAYDQEFADAVGGTYKDDETRGAIGQQIKINGVDTAAIGATPVLQDWLDRIQALPLHGTDFEAFMHTDGSDVTIVIASLTTGNLVIADGTAAGGLAATGLPAGTFVGGGDLQTGRADQENERRILTSLGVLVSHLRLIGSRTEARNLHFVLSRIATGVGSGGNVYEDRSSSVVGNIANPVFGTTDDIVIVIDNPGEGSTIETINVAVGGTGILSDLVSAINGAVTDSRDLVASIEGSKLKLYSENGRNLDVQATGTNDLATTTAGLEFAVAKSQREKVAEKVKADALDYFDTNARDLNL